MTVFSSARSSFEMRSMEIPVLLHWIRMEIRNAVVWTTDTSKQIPYIASVNIWGRGVPTNATTRAFLPPITKPVTIASESVLVLNRATTAILLGMTNARDVAEWGWGCAPQILAPKKWRP